MKPFRRSLTVGCGALAVLALAAASSADTQLWKTNASGAFNDAANWNLAVPDSDDIAYFRYLGGGTPAPYTVTFPSGSVIQGPVNYVSGALRVGPNTVSFVPPNPIFFAPATYTLNTAIEIGESSSIPSVLSTTLQILAAPREPSASLPARKARQRRRRQSHRLQLERRVDRRRPQHGHDEHQRRAQLNISGAEGNTIVGNSAGVHGTVNVGGRLCMEQYEQRYIGVRHHRRHGRGHLEYHRRRPGQRFRKYDRLQHRVHRIGNRRRPRLDLDQPRPAARRWIRSSHADNFQRRTSQ